MISSLSALSLAIALLLTFTFNGMSSYAVSAIEMKDSKKGKKSKNDSPIVGPIIKKESYYIFLPYPTLPTFKLKERR
jgi:hypothetical protein